MAEIYTIFNGVNPIIAPSLFSFAFLTGHAPFPITGFPLKSGLTHLLGLPLFGGLRLLGFHLLGFPLMGRHFFLDTLNVVCLLGDFHIKGFPNG